MTAHNCAQCEHLRRTSPTQVFLLCEFWSAKHPPVRGAASAYDYDWIVAHCHVQPEAPACAFFQHRTVSDGATSDTENVLRAT